MSNERIRKIIVKNGFDIFSLQREYMRKFNKDSIGPDFNDFVLGKVGELC